MKFRYKTIIGIASIEIILLGLIVFTVLSDLKNSNQTQMEQQINSITELFIASIKDAYLSDDQTTIDSITQLLASTNSIDYIKIINNQSEIVSSYGNETSINNSFIGDDHFAKTKDNIFDVQKNININDQVFGFIQFGFNVKFLNDSLLKTTQHLLFYAMLEVLLVAMFSYLLGNYLTRQLSDIKRANNAISQDNYSIILKPKSNDEIGDLARTYNLMRSQLLEAKEQRDEHEQTLKVLNNDLEVRIWNRTMDLEKSNQELKNTQSSLIEHEKLASIGLLSSGVAHEINNPLSSVNSNILTMQEYVTILANKLTSEDDKINFIIEDLPDLINDCLIATKQINTIVSGLKTFSSTQNQTTLKETQLSECFNQIFVLIKPLVPYHVKVKINIPDDIILIANQSKLIQLFSNLLINALDALEESKTQQGKIHITAKKSKTNMTLTISDNGIGMNHKTQQHLFDPFFTTKGVGKGTGLGLSIAYGIVEEFNGEISVKSQVNKGTQFIIKFPL
ncbi:MAG: GHKL domain-containing protein [Saccharospirillaceae bacterium]|nr:ATP-binding protein [Pseudomonadales bacterium]NRB80604.1 GHKL domain-containing protein [Saccharospirillaceae bacterium]